MKNIFVVALVLLAFGCDVAAVAPDGSVTVPTDTGTYTYTRTDFLTGHKSMLTEDGQLTVIRIDPSNTPDEVIVHVGNLSSPWDIYNYTTRPNDCVFTARLVGSDGTSRWFDSNTFADTCATPPANISYVLKVGITQNLQYPHQFLVSFRGSYTLNTSGVTVPRNMTLRSVN